MIEIKNLSKEYSSKNGIDCLALDNLSFTMPDNGMVFIIGKSGSGKSTFLNILGGLDSTTDGSVIVDGNEITNFTEKELENYRNTYLGFIFQEFFLIDSLTVFENVKLALDLLDEVDDERVYEAINKVGLKGFERKYPRQLSGGEKQRVAIARAIVKKPKLLLADELTGNLDDKNAKIVLDILKELSKELLVVVVSHNNDDANYYADRKIELSDGRIINDLSKTYDVDTPLITEKFINMPYHRKLTIEEVDEVNEVLPEGEYEFRQLKDGFTKTLEVNVEERNVDFKTSKLNLKNTLKYSFKFSKGNIGNSISTVIIFTILIVLLFICHVFEFTDVDYLSDEAYRIVDNDTHILYKADFPTNSKYYIEPSSMIEVTERDINEFYELGYEGNVYKVYGDVLSFHSLYTASPAENNVRKFFSISDLPYVIYGNQVIECDENLLIHKYGVDGKVNVLAGSLEEGYKDFGYVITDYAADCIVRNWSPYQGLTKEEAYERIVTDGHFNRNFTVKAIIDTDYETKYQELLGWFRELEVETDKGRIKEVNTLIQESPLTTEFLMDIEQYLSSGYFINQKMSFYEAYFHEDNPLNTIYVKFKNMIIVNGNNIIPASGYYFEAIREWDTPLEKGEITLSYELYNRLFGTKYTKNNLDEFVPHEITIKLYKTFEKDLSNVAIEKTFKINKILGTNSVNFFYLSLDDLREISKLTIYPSGVCFDNTESIIHSYVPNSLEFKPFLTREPVYESAYEVNEVISLVRDIFLFVIVGVSIVAIILLVSFTTRTINRKKRDVGIFKALGGKDEQFRNFFAIQLSAVLLLIIIFTILILLVFSGVFNEIFVNAISVALNRKNISQFTIVRFELSLLVIYYGVLLLLVLISSLLSLRAFRKIKPLNIIRNSR